MPCEKMNQAQISQETLQAKLIQIAGDATAFVKSRQTADKPFGHFNHCASALVNDEVSATSVALELWKMLALPMSEEDQASLMSHLKSLVLPSGLILDPSWAHRAVDDDPALTTDGDSFFTRCVIAALKAWNLQLPNYVSYLTDQDPQEMVNKIKWGNGAHDRYALGDIAVLLDHNARLGDPAAIEAQQLFIKTARERQDDRSGLWVEPMEKREHIHEVDREWTHHINRTFHIIKFIYNDQNEAIPHADKMIDTCLKAKDDEAFYSWTTGFACNELDLAHVFYSACQWSDHRFDEVQAWARTRLPMILSNQKPDGGFSFRHESTMTRHCRLEISPGKSEGDLWGTLMYLGAVNMMSQLAYPDIHLQWGFSKVHAVPTGVGSAA